MAANTVKKALLGSFCQVVVLMVDVGCLTPLSQRSKVKITTGQHVSRLLVLPAEAYSRRLPIEFYLVPGYFSETIH